MRRSLVLALVIGFFGSNCLANEGKSLPAQMSFSTETTMMGFTERGAVYQVDEACEVLERVSLPMEAQPSRFQLSCAFERYETLYVVDLELSSSRHLYRETEDVRARSRWTFVVQMTVYKPETYENDSEEFRVFQQPVIQQISYIERTESLASSFELEILLEKFPSFTRSMTSVVELPEPFVHLFVNGKLNLRVGE